jgi:hypothetical protein
MNKPLSPAAQAVMHAYLAWGGRRKLSVAAALRAAVAQVVPEPPKSSKWDSDWVRGMEDRQRIVRFRLLSIADELDPPNA